MDHLIGPQDVRRGDTSSGSADIKGFSQFHEFGTRKIGSPQKNGDLEADSRRAASWGVVQALAFFQELGVQIFSHSTTELVRVSACTMPHAQDFTICKPIIRIRLTSSWTMLGQRVVFEV